MNNEQTISKEDLFKERIEQSKRIEELVLETERLNKIIDDLEKYLIFKKNNAYELENPKKSKLKPYGIEKDMYHISYCRYYEILDKLKELKEEGKNNAHNS